MKIPAKLRSAVELRAGGRCEYCQLSQTGQEAAFHVDHIHPVVRGGRTELPNLALACVSCSLRKGAKVACEDPKSGELAAVFHPRAQHWKDHFRWNRFRVAGKTPTGRASVELLRMNRDLALAIRAEEARFGRHQAK